MIDSGKHQPHRDIATHGVRVWTRRVRLLDEQIGLGSGKPWEANPELDLDAESPRYLSHTDAGFDLGVGRERDALAPGDIPHDSQKARRIAGREQLLRGGPPAVRPAQLARPGHFQIQNAVGGHRPDIASGRCLHLSAVENLLDQRHSSVSLRSQSLGAQSLGAFEPTVVRPMFRFCSASASARAGPAGTR
jgi:hypothetical protein